jgi:transcriptional regulator with XRE-family HTH domain
MTEYNYNQVEVEKITGIMHTNISDFLSGKHLPSFENLVKLIDCFNTSADYFLGLDDIPTTEKLCEILPFNERLRYVLKYFSVSQEKLKKDLFISSSVVYKWVSGKSLPSIESLVKLAEYFDCSVDFLIGRVR